MSQSQDSLVIPELERSPAKSATGAAAAAITVLTTIFGLQLIRLFIPTLLFYLMDTLGLSLFALGGISAAVFLTSFLAGPLQRLTGLRSALVLTVGGTAVVRVAEQLSTSPPVDLVLGIAGTVLFLLYVPLGLGAARAFRPSRVDTFGLALLLGVAVDSALHIAAGTYDLTWQTGLLPTLVVGAFAAAALVALALSLNGFPAEPAGVPWRRAWPLMAVGPWLALQLIVFQNTARAAALTGWSLPAAGFLITAGNILGIVAAAWLGGAWSRRSAGAAATALALLLIPASLTSLGAALVILVGQILIAILFMRAISTSDAGSGESRGLGRSSIAYGAGFAIFFLLFFGYTAPNNLVLPYAPATVLPFMAFFVGLAVFIAPAQERQGRPAWSVPVLVAMAFVLLLAPLGLALVWQAAEPVAPAGQTSLRVMQYNLHNGFNVEGRLDMDALAAVIEAADPDVVTLQEVSRGWVITGSLDMLAWLANRLDMAYVPGPTTADGQWGNAILSRYPVVASENGKLYSEGQALKRGYLVVDMDVGGTTVRAISTHFYQHINVPEDSLFRQRQVTELLAAWDNAPRTIIAGDLNAWPEHPEMVMMAGAGLLDAVGSLTAEPVYTSPADEPYQRIDYIWLSPDLEAESFSVTQTTASDHLPVLVGFRFGAD